MPNADVPFQPTPALCEAAWLPLFSALDLEDAPPLDQQQLEALRLRNIVLEMTDLFTQTRWNQFATGTMTEQDGQAAFSAGQAALQLCGIKPIGKKNRLRVGSKPLPLALASFAARQWVGVDWSQLPSIAEVQRELQKQTIEQDRRQAQIEMRTASDGLRLWIACWQQARYHLDVLLAAHLGRPELPADE